MSVHRSERSLYAAAFAYTAVGGYLDAYSFITHHHVFANAQTGNIVLLAVALAGGDFSSALGHLPPILTFAAGVLSVLWLKEKRQLAPARLRLLGAGVEFTVLLLLLGLGLRTPDSLVVPAIAFVAAVQVTSFQSVSGWQFNSAMTTGNLRSTMKGLVLWLLGKEPAANRELFLATGAICVCFMAGAFLGGVCSRFFPRHALLPSLAGILAAALCAYRGDPADE